MGFSPEKEGSILIVLVIAILVTGLTFAQSSDGITGNAVKPSKTAKTTVTAPLLKTTPTVPKQTVKKPALTLDMLRNLIKKPVLPITPKKPKKAPERRIAPAQNGGGGGANIIIEQHPLPENALEVCGNATRIFPEIQERIGAEKKELNHRNFNELSLGFLTTPQGEAAFSETLTLNQSTPDLPYYIHSGAVHFAQDEDDMVGDYLTFIDGTYMFEYRLKFIDGLTSRVDADSNLIDLVGIEIPILGQNYTIVHTNKNEDQIQLSLLSGDIRATLTEDGRREGFLIHNQCIPIILVDVNPETNRALFEINDDVEVELGLYETFNYRPDGRNLVASIGVNKIYPHHEDNGEQQYAVDFYLNVESIIITDSDMENNFFPTFAGYDGILQVPAHEQLDVSINTEHIEDAFVNINASRLDNGDVRLDALVYRLKADPRRGDMYIVPSHHASEYLDEPRGLLGRLDITYEGLVETSFSRFSIRPNENQTGYILNFTNTIDEQFLVPLISTVSNVEIPGLRAGNEEHDLIAFESSAGSYYIDEGDWVVLDWFTDLDTGTYIVRYDSIDLAAESIKFTKNNELITVPYEPSNQQGLLGTFTLEINGHQWVGEISDGTNGWGNAQNHKYPLRMDIDPHNGIADDDVFLWAPIIVKGGGWLFTGDNFRLKMEERDTSQISYRVDRGRRNLLTIRTGNLRFENNGPLKTLESEVVPVMIIPSGNNLRLMINTSQVLDDVDHRTLTGDTFTTFQREFLEGENIFQGLSTYGFFGEEENKDWNSIFVEYPHRQRFGQVTLSTGSYATVRPGQECVVPIEQVFCKLPKPEPQPEPEPNILVTNVIVDPNQLGCANGQSEGRVVFVRATLENQGEGVARNVRFEAGLERDGVSVESPLVDIEPGQRIVLEVALQIPAGLPAEEHAIAYEVRVGGAERAEGIVSLLVPVCEGPVCVETDNGMDVLHQGTTTGIIGGVQQTVRDQCITAGGARVDRCGGDECLLQEAFCSGVQGAPHAGDTVAFAFTACDRTRCVDGTCPNGEAGQ